LVKTTTTKIVRNKDRTIVVVVSGDPLMASTG
jgi:precorrin-6B methylase 1